MFTCLDAERRRGADFNNAALTSLLCPLGFRYIIEGWLDGAGETRKQERNNSRVQYCT